MIDLRTKSEEEIDRILLDYASWSQLSTEELWDLLNISMILYGIRWNTDVIPYLFRLYRNVVETGCIDKRRESFQIVEGYIIIIRNETTVVALLPMVVCEPEFSIASSAALSLISNSTLTESGVPYGLVELDYLLKQRTAENMGAVFGGIACFGDRIVRLTLDCAKEYLTPEEVGVAARCRTEVVHFETLDFWLTWAEQLVADFADVSQTKLGLVASALVNQVRCEGSGGVREIRRHFKTENKDPMYELLKQWSIREYALEIAPRLYELERIEKCSPNIPSGFAGIRARTQVTADRMGGAARGARRRRRSRRRPATWVVIQRCAFGSWVTSQQNWFGAS